MATVLSAECPALTLVEDEPALLDVLQRAARSFAFECQTARSAEEAIALLERVLTPVVVTDLRMPGRGGVWLVREIQRRWPEVAVIVLTVGAEDESLHECLRAGVQRYFLKPIHLDEFHHALRATWDAQQFQAELLRQKRALEGTLGRATRRQRRTFFAAVTSLARTLEARDPYTAGHSLRVRDFALRLARRLGLARRDLQRLSLAAKLHDVGKVGLAEGILNKPGALTGEEWAQVREHPATGERILRPIIRSRAVLSAIRSHHERYDGGGYPDGLRGEAIPLLARIIAVADTFDALTSSRAYRAALSYEAALDILAGAAGTQFDPALVALFVTLIREHLSTDGRDL